MCIVFLVATTTRLTQFAEYMDGKQFWWPAVTQQLARLSLHVNILLAGGCKTATCVTTCSSRLDTEHLK
jgi:hypothetical protein